MKRIKKIISLILAFVLVIGICVPMGYADNAKSYEDFYYVDNEICGVYECVSGEITIPADIYGIEVNVINSLRCVDEDGNLTESDGIITKINISKNIREINSDLCDYNPYFEVDKDNPYFSSESGVLFDKDKTAIYSFPSVSDVKTYKAPDTVEYIREYAFRNNDTIEEIILPKNMDSIGKDAFCDCHNLELEISASVNQYFSCCSVNNIKQLNIDENDWNYLSQDNVVFNKNKTEVLFYAGYDEDGVDIVLPDTVKKIDDEAFKDKNINSIILPDSLEEMGSLSVSGCNITELNIPASLESMDKNYEVWFAYNDKLKAITVDEANENYSSEDGVLYNKDKTEIILYPAAKEDKSYTISENISYIWNYAFSDLSGLEEITVPEKIPEADSAFCDSDGFSSSLDKIYYESTLEEWMNYYSSDFDWEVGGCSYYSRPLCVAGNLYIGGKLLTDVTVDSNAVNPFAFAGCTSLQSVTLTDNVEKIRNSAFYGCRNLKSVNFGTGLKSIDMAAFRFCSSLEEVMLNSELSCIGPAAFSYCTSLKNTNLIDTSYKAFLNQEITDIFYGCSSLDSGVRNQYKAIKVSLAVRAFFISTFITPFTTSSGIFGGARTLLSNLTLSSMAERIYSVNEAYVREYDFGLEHCDESHYTCSGGHGAGGASSLLSYLINRLVKKSKKK